jgi:hypothetical protein
MVAVGAGEVFGETGLGAHFNRLAARGGQLAERDQFTTTTGVLDLVLKDSYSSYSVEELVSTDDDMFTKSSDVSDGNRTPREESVVV